MVVAKRGEYGAALFSGDEFFAIPGFMLEDVRDPTGAGDTFAGGFLGYLDSRRAAGESVLDHGVLRQAMAYGSVLASFNVEDFGTERVRSLTREEIDERLREFRRITHFDAEPAAYLGPEPRLVQVEVALDAAEEVLLDAAVVAHAEQRVALRLDQILAQPAVARSADPRWAALRPRPGERRRSARSAPGRARAAEPRRSPGQASRSDSSSSSLSSAACAAASRATASSGAQGSVALRPSQRHERGSVSPCPTSVTKMTATVR